MHSWIDKLVLHMVFTKSVQLLPLRNLLYIPEKLSTLTYFSHFVKGGNLWMNQTQSISKFQPIIKSAKPVSASNFSCRPLRKIQLLILWIYILPFYTIFEILLVNPVQWKQMTMDSLSNCYSQSSLESSFSQNTGMLSLGLKSNGHNFYCQSLLHVHGHSHMQQTYMINICFDIFILFENYSLLTFKTV